MNADQWAEENGNPMLGARRQLMEQDNPGEVTESLFKLIEVDRMTGWERYLDNMDFENRPRPTRYRGGLLIHAGLHHPDYGEFREASDLSRLYGGEGLNWSNMRGCSAERLEHHRYRPYNASALGVILGTVEVVDCHHADDCDHVCPEPEDWDPDDSLPCTEHAGDCNHHCSAWARPAGWHWQLRDAKPLKRAVPCKGKLGLWRLPEDVEKAVRAQLETGSS